MYARRVALNLLLPSGNQEPSCKCLQCLRKGRPPLRARDIVGVKNNMGNNTCDNNQYTGKTDAETVQTYKKSETTSLRTLITGGAGFIGSHLVERLLQAGHQVTVLDDLSTGSLGNLENCKGAPNLTLHQVDITDHSAISPLFRDIEWVFHLAGRTEVMSSLDQPLEYHQVNVNGTLSVIEAARIAGVKRFIYTASASCYGNSVQTPTPETAPVEMLHPYALTKYLGEQYTLNWGRIYNLPCVSLRLFNVYGPRARDSGAYASLMTIFKRQKREQQPLTVVGDGTQTRDFIFVADVADAFVKAAESGVKGEVFNIGSGETYSVNFVAASFGGPIVHIPPRTCEPSISQADASKAQRLLGWKFTTSIEDGIRSVMQAAG